MTSGMGSESRMPMLLLRRRRSQSSSCSSVLRSRYCITSRFSPGSGSWSLSSPSRLLAITVSTNVPIVAESCSGSVIFWMAWYARRNNFFSRSVPASLAQNTSYHSRLSVSHTCSFPSLALVHRIAERRADLDGPWSLCDMQSRHTA